jgi:hypothetical protein
MSQKQTSLTTDGGESIPFDTFTISQHTTEEEEPIVMGFSTKESTHDSSALLGQQQKE